MKYTPLITPKYCTELINVNGTGISPTCLGTSVLFQGKRKLVLLTSLYRKTLKFKVFGCTCTEIFRTFYFNVCIKMAHLVTVTVGVCLSRCVCVCLFNEAVSISALENNQSRQQRRKIWMEAVESWLEKLSRKVSSKLNEYKSLSVDLANILTSVWTLHVFDKN